MSENLIRQIQNETLNNNNLNQNDLKVLPSNKNDIQSDIDNRITKLDLLFGKLINSENYRENSELSSLYSRYKYIKENYNFYISINNNSEFENVKNRLDDITKNIINFTKKEPEKKQEEQLEVIEEIEEPIEIINEEKVPEPDESFINKSIRKKELNEMMEQCNIKIYNLVTTINENKGYITKIEKYLESNRQYLDSIDIYGYEKSIQKRKEKIIQEEKDLEEANYESKKIIKELNELNDINMAPTEVFNNLKEQIKLFKEQERIKSQLADLQEKVPEEYYGDMLNKSKKTNL